MAENPQKPNRPAVPRSNPTPATAATSPAGRLLSLDALRGFVMFWIIGGDELALAVVSLIPTEKARWVEQIREQFTHVCWEGFHAYDLIMPLFLFVVGAAMPYSFGRRAELGHSNRQMLFKLLRRTLILFVLGMAVQGHLLDFRLDTLHPFSNTLQAIAIGYLISGLLMLYVSVWGQVLATIFFLLLYWAMLMFIPIAVGGQEAVRGLLQERANVAYVVEQYVMGRFIDGTDPPYTWVLSSITFASTVLLGVFAGYILRSASKSYLKLTWLVLLGAVCLGAGWSWQQYLHFTIIKHIWTSSMVLWAAGWSYLLLALFYLVIDIVGLRKIVFPLVVIGMNAITAYVAYHLVIPFGDISKNLVGGLASHLGAAGPLLIALTAVTLVWLMLYHLYRHKVFLRI